MKHRYMIIFTFSTKSIPMGQGRTYEEFDKPISPEDVLRIEAEIKKEKIKTNCEHIETLFVSGFYKFEG